MTTPAPGGAVAARDVLVQRLVDHHGLDHDQALIAVMEAQRGISTGPYADLVTAEARAALTELHIALVRRSTELLRAMVQAFQPLAEAVRRAAQQMGRTAYVLAPPPSTGLQILTDTGWTDVPGVVHVEFSDEPPPPAVPPRPNRAARRHRTTPRDRPAWQSPYGPTTRH